MENLNEILTSIKKKLAELENNYIKEGETPQFIEKNKSFLIVEELSKKLYLSCFIDNEDLIFLLLESLYYLKSNNKNGVITWFENICEDFGI